MKLLNKNDISGYIDIDGFRLNYSIVGDNEGHECSETAVVIGSHIYYPRTFSENLCKKMRIIFMDHRGFGTALQPFMNRLFELSKIIDDIELLRQKLSLEKIILIGHSGHGYMAIEYAKKYPQNVSKIILIALSPKSEPENFLAADRYFAESVCPDRKKMLSNNLVTLDREISANPQRAFITRMLKFGPMIWYKYDYDASPLWVGVDVIPEMFDFIWGKVFPELDIFRGANKIEHKVFLALGRYDYWNPPHLWESVRGQFTDLTIRVFEKSGHSPQLEEPDLFDHELLTWIK